MFFLFLHFHLGLQKLVWVKECFQRRDHITVFNFDGGDSDSSKDIDVAILQALLKGTPNEIPTIAHKLELGNGFLLLLFGLVPEVTHLPRQTPTRYFFAVNKDQSVTQLKLALAWNRPDVARSLIFTEDKKWEVRHGSGKLGESLENLGSGSCKRGTVANFTFRRMPCSSLKRFK